jgi:hypothetical protein
MYAEKMIIVVIYLSRALGTSISFLTHRLVHRVFMFTFFAGAEKSFTEPINEG